MPYRCGVVEGQSRRLEYSETTRHALVESAVELFARHGYAATSLDEIARRARVTKGALYHHFSGKQALFEAVFAEVETTVMERMLKVVSAAAGDPLEQALAGLHAYIQVCLEPSYQRIVVHEGPVVMGLERWREAEDRCSFGLIRGTVQAMVDADAMTDLPVEVTSRLLFGLLSAAATVIATASEQEKTGAEVRIVIERMLEGLRSRP